MSSQACAEQNKKELECGSMMYIEVVHFVHSFIAFYMYICIPPAEPLFPSSVHLQWHARDAWQSVWGFTFCERSI